MEEENYPEYLYHYTNIEALALILQNRTIRFSPLNKMDDLQEAQSFDVRNIGQIIYVSSWTAEKTESIPMWNMYASLKSGVRIRMPAMPFKMHANNVSDFKPLLKMPVEDNSNGKPLMSLIPLEEMIRNKFYVLEAMNPHILYQVKYTDDPEKLMPHIMVENGKGLEMSYGQIGLFKNMAWKFQDEWRYRIQLIPFDFNQDVEKMGMDFFNCFLKISKGIIVQPVPYYDMTIDDQAFKQMKITESPEMSAGNKTILRALVNEYNPDAEIVESSLTGLV